MEDLFALFGVRVVAMHFCLHPVIIGQCRPMVDWRPDEDEGQRQ